MFWAAPEQLCYCNRNDGGVSKNDNRNTNWLCSEYTDQEYVHEQSLGIVMTHVSGL